MMRSAKEKKGIFRSKISLPAWLIFVFIVVSVVNTLIFVSIVGVFWRPDAIPAPITSDVVIGLHLQLFEAFLAALAIGLAVFGFVGYSAVKEAAERRAEDAARETTQAYLRAQGPSRASLVETPDFSGLNNLSGEADPVRETGI